MAKESKQGVTILKYKFFVHAQAVGATFTTDTLT